jgi:hypothetical protein
LDSLIRNISAGADGSVHIAPTDGTSFRHALDNSEDQAAFLSQIRTGTPARVENRFLMRLLIDLGTQLETLWQLALPRPASFGTLTDALPDKAERYAYRIRLVDPAGHFSEGAALLPRVVRVPSLRSPATPRFDLLGDGDDSLNVSARVNDSFDLRWLLLFVLSGDAAAAPDLRTAGKAQLLRLPNRRDLYPNDGVRLCLGDDTLLAPTAVEVSSGELQIPERLLRVRLTPGFDKRIAVWAVAMTRDGITSRFAGPRVAFTGPAPLSAPTVSVTTSDAEDHVAWAGVAAGVEIAVERNADGGATWTRVSPWLPETVTTYAVAVGAGGARTYRLVLRGARNQTAAGPATGPS